ncbi:MAG: hypothetical protein MR332_14085 [Fusicatenibacter sp.]|nr:hypothetical protein [Fusicatenibacter sp.]
MIPLMICILVYGLAWITGIGTLGEYQFSQILVFATAGVLINCFAALGEEIGWRGFLLTELRQLVPFLALFFYYDYGIYDYSKRSMYQSRELLACSIASCKP